MQPLMHAAQRAAAAVVADRSELLVPQVSRGNVHGYANSSPAHGSGRGAAGSWPAFRPLQRAVWMQAMRQQQAAWLITSAMLLPTSTPSTNSPDPTPSLAPSLASAQSPS